MMALAVFWAIWQAIVNFFNTLQLNYLFHSVDADYKTEQDHF